MAIGGLSSWMTMGNMQNYMKNTELTMKFEERKQNIALKKKGEVPEPTQREREMAHLQEQMAKIRENQPVAELDLKLKSGGELTDEELEYLREKNPELYKKAIEVKRERAAYKKELENCRTKEDVERVRSSKLHRFTAEIKDIKGNPNIGEAKKLELIEQVGRRFMGILSEHSRFVETKKYKDLPTEEELRSGRKRKESEEEEQPEIEMENDLLAAKIEKVLGELLEIGQGTDPTDAEPQATEATAPQPAAEGTAEPVKLSIKA